MKKQEIEKLIREDLSKSAPDDFSTLRGRMSNRATEEEVEFALQPAYVSQGGGKITGAGKGLWKRLLAIGLAFLLLVSAGAILLVHLLGNKKIDAGYFVIEINPSIQISYDENGIVTEAEGLNLDGKTLLTTTQLVGQNYQNAMDTVFNRCVALGYFNLARDNNAILVSANKSTGGTDANLSEEIKQKFTSLFASRDMQGAVLTGLAETQSLVQVAQGYGIDAQKYALIKTAQALGVTIEEEEYATISVSAIYGAIQEKTWAQVMADIEQLWQGLETESTALFASLKTDLEVISAQLETLRAEADILSAPRYQLYKEWIDGYLSGMTGEFSMMEKRIQAELIMHTLDEMRRAESGALAMSNTLINLLHQAHGRIQLALESINKKFAKINYVQGEPNALGGAREEKFQGGNLHGESEFNFVEVWQQTQAAQAEENFYSTWYEVKQKWKEYRVEDLQ